MYIFVLEWTPALEPVAPFKDQTVRKLLGVTVKQTTDGHRGSIPHGQIFAAFMVSSRGICQNIMHPISEVPVLVISIANICSHVHIQ